MSADNWAMCPRCKRIRKDAADAAVAGLAAAYGKVGIAEFNALRAEADRLLVEVDNPSRADRGETFREDYEISGAEDGEVIVNYRGGCSNCNLSLSFEHIHALDVES